MQHGFRLLVHTSKENEWNFDHNRMLWIINIRTITFAKKTFVPSLLLLQKSKGISDIKSTCRMFFRTGIIVLCGWYTKTSTDSKILDSVYTLC